jgi:hypothetical protein
MLTATQLYNAVTRTGSNYASTVATEPAVKQQTSYFLANIGKVTTAQQLVNNSRLYNYVMNAFGLGSETNEKALITKVLEGVQLQGKRRVHDDLGINAADDYQQFLRTDD